MTRGLLAPQFQVSQSISVLFWESMSMSAVNGGLGAAIVMLATRHPRVKIWRLIWRNILKRVCVVLIDSVANIAMRASGKNAEP